MNSNLLKHKPHDSSNEDFQKMWDNAGYTLSPLHKLLKEIIANNNKISKDDFSLPNHYPKLMFQAGENKAYEYVLSLLPDSSKD